MSTRLDLSEREFVSLVENIPNALEFNKALLIPTDDNIYIYNKWSFDYSSFDDLAWLVDHLVLKVDHSSVQIEDNPRLGEVSVLISLEQNNYLLITDSPQIYQFKIELPIIEFSVGISIYGGHHPYVIDESGTLYLLSSSASCPGFVDLYGRNDPYRIFNEMSESDWRKFKVSVPNSAHIIEPSWWNIFT